jgi:hypothetical protein
MSSKLGDLNEKRILRNSPLRTRNYERGGDLMLWIMSNPRWGKVENDKLEKHLGR